MDLRVLDPVSGFSGGVVAFFSGFLIFQSG